MLTNPYLRFRDRPLTLNDLLSIDRTILANERSVLAYGRTALALAAIGGSCFAFFESTVIQALGAILIVAGAALMARGWHRYRRMQRTLAAALEQLTGTPEHPLESKPETPPPQADA